MTSINPIFEPFIEAHRYKVAKGGRGSGKSWAIARLLVEAARRQPVRILCARELQNSISDSVIRLLEDTIEREGYSAEFEIQRSMIRHLGTNAEFMFYGIKNNPTKIKSLEGIDICWVEEAEAVTKESWDILIPTIRKPFSEIWVSFNPKNILDDTYQRFVVNPPDDICLLTVNYTDNPHFPEVLRLEMEECKRRNPTLYRHIWLGEPVSASDMAIIKREWLEAATDAHKKLGWKAKGAVVSAHDPSDTGPDAKGYASRHGSVVKRIAEGLLMDINEGADWATSLAIEDGLTITCGMVMVLVPGYADRQRKRSPARKSPPRCSRAVNRHSMKMRRIRPEHGLMKSYRVTTFALLAMCSAISEHNSITRWLTGCI